jgi:diaminopimelate epimerase
MQGIGNDYIYVDCFPSGRRRIPPNWSAAIADRHFGVGGDGLILICPSERADARMHVQCRRLGSEMCGNGLRCVAKYVYDHGIARKAPFTDATAAGTRAAADFLVIA